jgi:low temperature requirement protein LtrA
VWFIVISRKVVTNRLNEVAMLKTQSLISMMLAGFLVAASLRWRATLMLRLLPMTV